MLTRERHCVVGQLAPQSLQQPQSELTVVVVFRLLVPETVVLCRKEHTGIPSAMKLLKTLLNLRFLSTYVLLFSKNS